VPVSLVTVQIPLCFNRVSLNPPWHLQSVNWRCLSSAASCFTAGHVDDAAASTAMSRGLPRASREMLERGDYVVPS
jgi:hypothetical protein